MELELKKLCETSMFHITFYLKWIKFLAIRDNLCYNMIIKYTGLKYNGEMSERLKVVVSKTTVQAILYRGFESLSLRQRS